MAEEIKIPVPWGHISGKRIGPPDGQVILCLHGIQDNAGTFDRLIPYLPQAFQYVALDLPGHGMSSHFERGRPLHFIDFIYSIKLVVDHYKWNKIIILAHSFSCQITFVFASLYPEICLKIVGLDGLLPNMSENEKVVKYLRNQFDSTQEVEEILTRRARPSYSYDEALERFISNRFYTNITTESAEILIKRSLIKYKDTYCFSTDQRLKKPFNVLLTKEHLQVIVNNFKCPILLLVASKTHLLVKAKVNDTFRSMWDRLEMLKNSPQVTVKVIEGSHDVHLNNAPYVAEHITSFLIVNKSSL